MGGDWVKKLPSVLSCIPFFYFFFKFFIHTTHTTKAERTTERITPAPQAPACGQKTKCCIFFFCVFIPQFSHSAATFLCCSSLSSLLYRKVQTGRRLGQEVAQCILPIFFFFFYNSHTRRRRSPSNQEVLIPLSHLLNRKVQTGRRLGQEAAQRAGVVQRAIEDDNLPRRCRLFSRGVLFMERLHSNATTRGGGRPRPRMGLIFEDPASVLRVHSTFSDQLPARVNPRELIRECGVNPTHGRPVLQNKSG